MNPRQRWTELEALGGSAKDVRYVRFCIGFAATGSVCDLRYMSILFNGLGELAAGLALKVRAPNA